MKHVNLTIFFFFIIAKVIRFVGINQRMPQVENAGHNYKIINIMACT